MSREINVQDLQNDRFFLAFEGEAAINAVMDNWSQLLDTIFREVHRGEGTEHTAFHVRLLDPDNWTFDDADRPYSFFEDLGEMCSLTIYRISGAVVPGSGLVGERLLKEPLTDEFIAKLGGKEETASSGYKLWDFVYSFNLGDPNNVENILRIHSPQCQPGEGAGVSLYEKRRGFLDGLELFNNYCHTVGELLELLKALKIQHASPWS